MIIIYFYHIPKTAGNYIYKNLQKILQTEDSKTYNFYDGPLLKKQGKYSVPQTRIDWEKVPQTYTPNSDKKIKEISDFIKNIPKLEHEYVLVHHHNGYCGLKDISVELRKSMNIINSDNGTFYLFTCLREIIPWINSHINFCVQIGINHSVESHLTNSKTQNYQSKYLLYNSSFWENDIEISKEEVLETLPIINKIYTDNLDEIKTDLSRIMGKDIAWDYKKRNISKKTIEISEDEKLALIDKNETDMWFYNLAKNKYQSRSSSNE